MHFEALQLAQVLSVKHKAMRRQVREPGSALERGGCGWKTVPWRAPAMMAGSCSGRCASQMAMWQPAAVARRAAVSLVAMPPVPHCVPAPPVSTCPAGHQRMTQLTPCPDPAGPLSAASGPHGHPEQVTGSACRRCS